MENRIAMITSIDFFQARFAPHCAKVSGRRISSLTSRKSGTVLIRSEEASFISKKDTLTFVPSRCPYETEIIEGGDMYVLHFEIMDSAPNFFAKPMCIKPTQPSAFLKLFEDALHHQQNKTSNPYRCFSDAYRLLSEAHALQRIKGHAPDPRLIDCKNYMDENIGDASLRVSLLASLYQTSEVYFRKEFRKCYGISPSEYIKKARLELACNLLLTGIYSISDVATRTGFDSISYFLAEFHRIIACTPSQYSGA